jgi:hypothetical protein
MNGLATAELWEPKAAMSDVILGFEFGDAIPTTILRVSG